MRLFTGFKCHELLFVECVWSGCIYPGVFYQVVFFDYERFFDEIFSMGFLERIC